jgi:hypothetical protein
VSHPCRPKPEPSLSSARGLANVALRDIAGAIGHLDPVLDLLDTGEIPLRLRVRRVRLQRSPVRRRGVLELPRVFERHAEVVAEQRGYIQVENRCRSL